jgi:hypothetical protein
MFKKITTLFLLSSTALVSLAQAGHHPHYRSGFFVGAHLGGSFGSGRFNSLFNGGTGGANSVLWAAQNASQSRFMGGISGGYRHVFHNGITLGGSVVLNWLGHERLAADLEYRTSDGEVFLYNNSIKRSYSLTPGLNIGKVFFNRYHVSVGFGLGISRFTHGVYNKFADILQEKKRTVLAFVPSVGLDYAVTQKILVSTNISYEIYSRVKRIFGEDLQGDLPNSFYDSNIRPRFFIARVGLTYQF